MHATRKICTFAPFAAGVVKFDSHQLGRKLRNNTHIAATSFCTSYSYKIEPRNTNFGKPAIHLVKFCAFWYYIHFWIMKNSDSKAINVTANDFHIGAHRIHWKILSKCGAAGQ
jgi:hypothetical protein